MKRFETNSTMIKQEDIRFEVILSQTNSTSTQVKVGLWHNSVLNMELLKYFQETLQADFRLNWAISQDLKKAIQCALDGTNQLLFSNINIYLLWSHFEDNRVDNK